MLDAIKARNLRSFINSEFVELKPITAFVGKNSSGKSSFLRILPLLRQSLESKTKGPILWYGSYVDFGAFSEAKTTLNDEGVICFDFSLSVPLHGFSTNAYQRSLTRKLGLTGECKTKISLGITNKKEATVFDSAVIEIDGRVIEIKYISTEKCSLKISSGNFIFEEDNLHYKEQSLIPSLQTKIKESYFIDMEGALSERTYIRIIRYDPQHKLKPKTLDNIKKYFYRTTNHETIISGLTKIPFSTDNTFLETIIPSLYRDNAFFINNFEKNKSEIMEVFKNYLFIFKVTEIIDTVNRFLVHSIKNIKYIAPLRATAERYYRYQDLQVDEIDHTGSNLAMLLSTLSETDKISFSEWAMENLDFSVRAEESGLHYAIKIKVKGTEKEYNINDMGFGFSQILPIITSLWLGAYKNIKNLPRNGVADLIYAIEQPELHLHPELQSRLARLFAKTIRLTKDNGINLKIVFETHSKAMIDAIGQAIEDKIIEPSDVNISIFEKESIENETKINFAEFDKDGYLKKWPIGFFSGV